MKKIAWIYDELNIKYISKVSNKIELTKNWMSLINKVRQTEKIFCHSPAKMEILENFKKESGNNLLLGKIFLDVKTRWNTLEEMLNIF